MLLTKTSRSTNSMKISLSHSWEIEVYDNVDGLDIDTTRKEIGANQVSAKTLNSSIKITLGAIVFRIESTNLSKIVEYSVSVLLIHSSVDIKARIAKIGNFLGQKFDSLKNV